MKENGFIVYCHVSLDCNEVFYIGIGNKLKRAYSKDARSKFWHWHIAKHGYYVEILHNNLTKEEAIEYEKYYIFLYGRRDIKTGILINMTEGGDGLLSPSQETLDRISKALKGRKTGPRSEEIKRKISLSNKGKKPSALSIEKTIEKNKKRCGNKHFFFGKHRSEEDRNKIRNTLKGRINTPEQIEKWKKSYYENRSRKNK